MSNLYTTIQKYRFHRKKPLLNMPKRQKSVFNGPYSNGSYQSRQPVRH